MRSIKKKKKNKAFTHVSSFGSNNRETYRLHFITFVPEILREPVCFEKQTI